MVAKIPLIVIVGETASGKSDIAFKLAKRVGGEIICADSWTVYKGFDIGTAKPSSEELKQIKHHMLDVADPNKGYSAAEFKRSAEAIIKDIRRRKKVPILVGGSGLYIDSIIYDYSFLPASESQLREKYNQMSLVELNKLVGEKGYDTTNIDLNNKRRVIRLLENEGIRPSAKPIAENVLIYGIKMDKTELEQNIKDRVEKMFEQGLVGEVEKLNKKFGWEIEPMKGIGYREFKAFFDGQNTLENTKQLIIKNTLNLAKKQRTWFKRNNSIQWLTNRENIVENITTNLNKLSE